MSNLGFGRRRRNAAEQAGRAYCWGTSTAVATLSPGTPMRPFFPLLALATLLAAPAPAQQPARPDTARSQRTGGQAEGPKPYADVITKAATTDSGVFILHQLGEKLFYEIPRAQLNKEFLLVVDYAATPEGTRYGGGELPNPGGGWPREGDHRLLGGGRSHPPGRRPTPAAPAAPA